MNRFVATAYVALFLAARAAVLPAAPAPAPAVTPPAPASLPPGPPPRGRWQPIPEFTDEFNGTALDAAKWLDHSPTWKGRMPGLFSPRNIAVSGGELQITMRKEDVPKAPKGYHTYTCGLVRSQTPVQYGYFEIRARPMKSHGSSSFWFAGSSPQWRTEIDMFEIGAAVPGRERKVHMNVHVFRTPTEDEHWSMSEAWEAPFNLADDFHVYALEWDREQLVFYVDGVARRTIKNTHWHQPLHLIFDSETMGDWFGLPKDEELPATFRIDYVRAWRRTDSDVMAPRDPPDPPPARPAGAKIKRDKPK